MLGPVWVMNEATEELAGRREIWLLFSNADFKINHFITMCLFTAPKTQFSVCADVRPKDQFFANSAEYLFKELGELGPQKG